MTYIYIYKVLSCVQAGLIILLRFIYIFFTRLAFVSFAEYTDPGASLLIFRLFFFFTLFLKRKNSTNDGCLIHCEALRKSPTCHNHGSTSVFFQHHV